MTDSPLSRRLFIAKAAPLIAATTMPAVIGQAAPVDPVEHMRAIMRHFDSMAPDAGRFMVQIGGTRETVGYAAYAYVSSWVTDTRLRGGGYWRDDATELSRRSCS